MLAPDDATTPASSVLQRLAGFSGTPREFWPLFLEATLFLTGAARASLHRRNPAVGWQRLIVRSAADLPRGREWPWPEVSLLDAAEAGGVTEAPPTSGGSPAFVVFQVGGGEDGGDAVVALAFAVSPAAAAIRPALLALAEWPAQYVAVRLAEEVRQENGRLRTALDLGLLVQREDRFLSAGMVLCNELAAALGCERVVLGWLTNDQIIRVRAISHAEKFERKTDIVRRLEVAMEEAIDEGHDVVFPPQDHPAPLREHGAYARESGAGCLCTLPLVVGERAVGALLAERRDRAFTTEDVRRLRLACDQATRRLAFLEEKDHWIGWRLTRWIRHEIRTFLDSERTAKKLGAVVGALCVIFLLFGRLPYRVEAPAALRSDQVAFVTAPFDGYVQDVVARVGDEVATDAVLARFDTRELLLQQSSALANVNRYQQEAEKARASGDLAEMRIGQAQVEQAKAALEQTRYHLGRAEIRAPFGSVVVEGDLRKKIGSPFRQGEVLFQVARLDALYVELEVPERDVHEILDAKTATISLASAPENAVAVTIERVHPSVQSRPAGGVFLVRARLPEGSKGWLRPGMTGVGRIKAGWRNPLWIWTHRTFDWFRLHVL
jgi:multidrug resistance efflux pump